MIAEFADYSHRKVVGLELPVDLKLAWTSDPTLASCLLPDMSRNKCGSRQPTGYWNTPTNSWMLSLTSPERIYSDASKMVKCKIQTVTSKMLLNLYKLQSCLTLFYVRQQCAHSLFVQKHCSIVKKYVCIHVCRCIITTYEYRFNCYIVHCKHCSKFRPNSVWLLPDKMSVYGSKKGCLHKQYVNCIWHVIYSKNVNLYQIATMPNCLDIVGTILQWISCINPKTSGCQLYPARK